MFFSAVYYNTIRILFNVQSKSEHMIFYRLSGWCYLAGVKDPRWNEPEEYCYDDIQWSETDQKYWSSDACKDVPVTGFSVPSTQTSPDIVFDVE